MALTKIPASMTSFMQSGTGAVLRTVQSKLLDFVNIKDFGAVGDGITDDTLAVQRAFDTGKRVTASEGTFVITQPIVRVSNNISLIGSGISSCIFKYTGGGRMFDFTAAANFLQTGRVRLEGFTLTTDNNVAKSVAFVTYTEQAIRLTNFHGSVVGPFLVSGFRDGLEMSTCYHNTLLSFSSVGTYKGLILSGGSSGNAIIGGVHASSSFDFSDSTNNVMNAVDIEPGTCINYLGDGNIFSAVRFERVTLDVPLSTWVDMGSDNKINMVFHANGVTIQPDGSCYVRVNGSRNTIETTAPYVHRNGFYFGLNSSNNLLTIKGDYNDVTNTGSTNYVASRNWVLDYGRRNRLVVVAPNGTSDITGDTAQSLSGSIPNGCPADISGFTVTGCTTASIGAGYVAPLGAPAGDLLVRECTLTATSFQMDSGALYVADGVTVYSSDCYVLIPSTGGVPGITLRSVINNGGNTIDATKVGGWVRLWQVGLPLNGQGVRLELSGVGAIGSKFLMAFPRCGPGYASGYTPPGSASGNANIVGGAVSGKYTPVATASGGGFVVSNGSLTGSYARQGKVVTATVELSFGTGTAVGSGFYEFTLPSKPRVDRPWNCTGSLYDASTATSYVFGGYVNSPTGKVRLMCNGIVGQSTVGAAAPVVPATNDYLTFTITYEEA